MCGIQSFVYRLILRSGLVYVLLLGVMVQVPVWGGETETPGPTAVQTLGKSHLISGALRSDWQDFKSANCFFVQRSVAGIRHHPYILAGTAGAIIHMANNKRGIQDEAAEHDLFNIQEDTFKFARHFGNWGLSAAFAAGCYTTGLFAHRPALRETGLMVGEALFLAGSMTIAGQFVFSESRPSKGGTLHFLSPAGHGVSGHASTSMAAVAVLLKRYIHPWKPDKGIGRFGRWLILGAGYALPTLTAMSRIQDERHYLWNVTVGALAGYYAADTVVKHRRSQQADRTLSVEPFVGKDAAGINVIWRLSSRRTKR